MALVTSEVLVPTNGTIYLAVSGTVAPAPADLAAPTTPWKEFAYLDNDKGIPTWKSDGGKASTLGAWQNSALRVVTTALSETINFTAVQVDETTLKAYTGAAGGTTSGQFDVKGSEVGSGTPSAFLMVFRDGTNLLGFHAKQVQLGRGDDISPATDTFLGLPISATLLDYDSTSPRYSWIASWITHSS